MMKEKGDFYEIHPTRLPSFFRYPYNERVGEKIKEETATTEKQKGKCGIKQLGVLWVGTPIDEAKVDLPALRPLPLVRLLKNSLLPTPTTRTSLSSGPHSLVSPVGSESVHV